MTQKDYSIVNFIHEIHDESVLARVENRRPRPPLIVFQQTLC